MYIKTYEPQNTSSTPQLTPNSSNLATTTQQGLNLNRLLLRRHSTTHQKSKIDKIYPDKHNNKTNLIIYNKDHIVMKREFKQQAEIIKYPHFYRSNCFGVFFRNCKQKGKKEKEMGEGAGGDREDGGGNGEFVGRKIRGRKKQMEFSISGRPASRNQQYIPNITKQSFNKQTKSTHQTVLDFSKLTKLPNQTKPQTHIKYADYIAQYHKIMHKKPQQQTQPQHFHTSNNQSPTNWQLNYKYSNRHPYTHRINRETYGDEDSNIVTQPQILVDYRRSMSSGRKRVKAKVWGQGNQVEDKQGKYGKQGKEGEFVGVQGEKIGGWAVRKVEDYEQLIF